jgi:hypothetical protein
MKTFRLIILLFLAGGIILSSCKKKDKGLSEDEIIQGLKEALKVGTDSSATKLHKTDGYYGDALVKIMLPPDAHGVLEAQNNAALQAAGVDQKIEDVIKSLNKAAEDAAIEAKPIFVDAITNMTVNDAFNILHGTDTAATYCLETNTRTGLYNLFIPKVQVSLNKDLGLGYSANEAWEALKNIYNPLCNALTGWQPITSDLDEYATNKGLDGLFLKVAEEEKSIRSDPAARINDILQKVFGELD